MHSLFLDLSINTLHSLNDIWMPRTTKHSGVIPLFFDNPFSSCWELSYPCDCFYVAPSSWMKADTTNTIWGGWRTIDVKIVSVLILLSKHRHIFLEYKDKTTQGEWCWYLPTPSQQLLQCIAETTGRRLFFMPWGFIISYFT